MSAPFFRSISDGISQIFDDTITGCGEGYNDFTHQVAQAQQTATQAGRTVGRAMGRTLGTLAPYADHFVTKTAPTLLLAGPGPIVLSALARGFIRAAKSFDNENGNRSLQRYWDHAGIGRPLTAPSKEVRAGLELLLDSIIEFFYPSRNFLVSPGGTEHMNPNRIRHLSPRVYTETFRRSHTTEIINISRLTQPSARPIGSRVPHNRNHNMSETMSPMANEVPSNSNEE